jgi:hypothetical protein
MGSRDEQVDAYIAAAAEFARPILMHLRGLIHEAAPEIDETLKWGMPYFEYRGLVCGTAAFRSHCALTFRHGQALTGKASGTTGAMGQFGRITSLADLPDDAAIRDLVRRAVALNEAKAAKRVEVD